MKNAAVGLCASVVVVLACDQTKTVSDRQSVTPTATAPTFSQKVRCFEVGQAFVKDLKASYARMTFPSEIKGEAFAYNARLDTCIVRYEVWFNNSPVHVYTRDMLTGLLLAETGQYQSDWTSYYAVERSLFGATFPDWSEQRPQKPTPQPTPPH